MTATIVSRTAPSSLRSAGAVRDASSNAKFHSCSFVSIRGCTVLLRAAKLPLQFAIVHFDDRRATVWTGVWHRTATQVLDEIFQFATSERIVRLHRMTANCLYDD